MRRGIVPMLARLGPLPAEDGGWSYEIKWDGIRALAYVEDGAVSLVTRNGNDVTARWPELAGLAEAVGRDALLDGEVVAFDDERGLPSFQALQRGGSAVYMAFDLLSLDGEDLMPLPYLERRERLASLGLAGERWQTPAHHIGDGEAFLASSREQGLEGIVAKRVNSRYEPGKRTGAWIKVKNTARQELVIGGWMSGEGRRKGRIGALLFGYYDGDDFRFAGKVGTGFTQAELDRLAGLLAPLEVPESPFAGPPPKRGAHWVRPELVAEIEFTEWTRDGLLRHASYKGLRDDKRARDVVRES